MDMRMGTTTIKNFNTLIWNSNFSSHIRLKDCNKHPKVKPLKDNMHASMSDVSSNLKKPRETVKKWNYINETIYGVVVY